MSDSLIIIPTYNEKENIENILNKVFSLEKSFHVLIVDDGSPDGTANIVKRLQNTHSGLFIEERKGKLGLGTAYIHGFKWALKRDYQFRFYIPNRIRNRVEPSPKAHHYFYMLGVFQMFLLWSKKLIFL